MNVERRGGEGRMQTETWVGTCPSPGQLAKRSNIANSGRSFVASFTHAGDHASNVAAARVCVAVVLLNCTTSGQPATCNLMLNLGATRVSVHSRS